MSAVTIPEFPHRDAWGLETDDRQMRIEIDCNDEKLADELIDIIERALERRRKAAAVTWLYFETGCERCGQTFDLNAFNAMLKPKGHVGISLDVLPALCDVIILAHANCQPKPAEATT